MKGVPNIPWEVARLYAKMFISRSSLLGTSTELVPLVKFQSDPITQNQFLAPLISSKTVTVRRHSAQCGLFSLVKEATAGLLTSWRSIAMRVAAPADTKSPRSAVVSIGTSRSWTMTLKPAEVETSGSKYRYSCCSVSNSRCSPPFVPAVC